MTPSIPASALEQAFKNPIVYGLLLVLVVCYLLAEITGKLEGPINRIVVRRRAVAQKAADALGTQPAELVTMRLQMDGMAADVARLLKEQAELGKRLDWYQRAEELRDDLTMVHRVWDNEQRSKLIDLGQDVPPPPPLHVHPSMLEASE